MKLSVCGLCLLCLVASAEFVPLPADASGAIAGSVASPSGALARDARVTLVELRRSMSVDDEGRFRFDDVPPGDYHLQAVSRGLGSCVRELEFRGGLATVELILDVSPHRERIVVSAMHDRGSDEVSQPVDVLDRTDLSASLAPTLGETLESRPGVSSTYFGPGSSRPVIRGQGGARLGVLEGGLSSGDASTTSPDHAVSSDPIAAERVEILRGPATLLYGSTAVGGVVNVIDQRVPEFVPPRGLSGHVTLRHGGAADETAGSAVVDGGAGSFAWHADLLSRDSDDYDIPGTPVRGDDAGPRGTLPNSSIESEGATVGGSWVGDRGFVGAAIRSFDTNYGIPADIEGEEAPARGVAAPGIRIDLDQLRGDVRGAFALDGAFDEVRFAAGVTDYEHRELEGSEVGTRFLTETIDARVEASHARGRAAGVIGAQLTTRDFEAIGEEAFVPPSQTETAALFALQDLHLGEVRWEVGARVERRRVETTATASPAPGLCGVPRGRDLTGASGSGGLTWLPGDSFGVAVSLAYTERLPSAEELYSCGEHAATQSFEVGDPDLAEERSLGLDVSLRKRTGRLTGELTMFANRYDDYVIALPDGATVGDLPVFAFGSIDAEFVGLEIRAVVELLHLGARHLDLELQADWVDGEDRASGAELPYITPTRSAAALSWQGDAWYGAARARRVASAARAVTTPFDVAGRTASSTLLDAHVGYRLVRRGAVHDLMLRGTNLGDEEARNHASRLRDRVPLPGRGVELVYSLAF